MISRRTRVQLAIFALITMVGVAFVGARYAQLNRLLYDTSYTVVAHFHDSGGMYAGGLVSYRGVAVGKVAKLLLTRDGVDAYLDIDQGWEGMFMPDDPNREHPKRELRCFDDEQWARFDRLYRESDFAGIQLYADLLPDECVRAFHERYGEPRASEPFPRLGRVEFIPRGR